MDGAVAEVFERMLERGCSALPECSVPESVILARIRFSGAIEAQCVLEFPLISAHRLTDAFLGAEGADWEDSMLTDTVGELCNMIAGGWKKRLGTSAWGAHLSVPLISRGSDTAISRVRAITMHRVYTFDDSAFAVRLTVL